MKRLKIRKAIRKIKLAVAGGWKIRSILVTASTRQRADRFFENRDKNLIFMLSTGRSGTQLVSGLLAATGQAIIYHEPNFIEDVGTLENFHKSPELVVDYWRKFRKYQIYNRWSASPEKKIYGEVNATIRYQVPGIKSEFPNAKLFLLSRDGRGVVRSVMGWPQFYGPKSKGPYAIRPRDGDPYAENWDALSRFEKICWGWMETNEYLLDQIPDHHRFRLEDIVKNFDFTRKMLAEVGLDIQRDSWEEIVSRPSRNANKSYSFPGWDDWDDFQKLRFTEICGSTMKKLGYRIE